MPKNKSKRAARKLSVAKALQDLNRLKKVDSYGQSDNCEITETYTKESTNNNLLEQEPTSDTLNQDAETGIGFNTPRPSKEEIDSKIENANLKVESKIKDDIHSIKDKCSSISLGVSLSVCGVISAILIAVMIYMNNGLKSDISILKKELMTKIDSLSSIIKNVKPNIVKPETQSKVVSKSAGQPNDKTEK